MSPSSSSDERVPLSAGAEAVWALLLILRTELGEGRCVDGPTNCTLSPATLGCGDAQAQLVLDPGEPSLWRPCSGFEPSREQQDMLTLYLPLLLGSNARRMVVAHLGQSLDGRIATTGGISKFITGPENLLHTHRLRALFDAVLVGSQTALADDPQLTTRLAEGPHPTRVLLDSQRRLGAETRALSDGIAPTLLVCPESGEAGAQDGETLHLPMRDGLFDPRALVDALHARGLGRVFIEGGGVTVSHFLQAGLLDRLHICVAPMILGSGRPSISLDAIESLDQGIRTEVRHFQSGRDILFDCHLQKK